MGMRRAAAIGRQDGRRLPGAAVVCGRGLLGAKRSKGIVMLAPCNDVHTFGMAELIDIAFLDEQGRVLESYRAVGPRRRIRCRKAVAVLERFSVNDPPWFSAGERVEMTRKDGAGK